MNTDSLSLEPRTRNALGLSLLSSLAIGLAAFAIGAAPVVSVYLVWLFPVWELAVCLGMLVLAVEVACFFVCARLTRDDRHIGQRLQEGDAALAELAIVTADRDKWRKIAEGAQPVVMPVKEDAKFVPAHVRDAAWSDARMLLTLVQGDYGRVPGQPSTGLTQAAQAAAVQVLVNAGLVKRRGNQYELATTRAEAVERLESVP